MKERIYAAIDIGSNAVRLLIKKEDPHTDVPELVLKKQLLVRVPLRLGFDVFSEGVVSQEKCENLVRIIRAYKELIHVYKVDRFRACATSALRDASNFREVLERIKKDTDIDVDILDGEEEARIVYNNHVERSGYQHGTYLFVDVGGGSTEINFMVNGRLRSSRSFNIGTVRILMGKVDPEEWDKVEDFMCRFADNYPDIVIIGSGGNINKLYKLSDNKDESARSMKVSDLKKLYETLKPLSIEQRMDRYSLREDRADVIVPAAEIFIKIASIVDSKTICVPKLGVADGIIDGLYLADHQNKC